MSSSSNVIHSPSKELVLYGPALPHSSVKAHLEAGSNITRKADSAYRRSAEERYVNTYKALHIGGTETPESGMIRSAIVFCSTHTEKEMAERLSHYNKATQYLRHLTDKQLDSLLKAAKPLGSGTGGDVLSIEVEGIPLFVKKIRLTTIEQQNPGSTLNLFELPLYYQYGVGSMGFGVWRELASHEMTTQWVLNGECQNFPLLYHSRVLQRPTVQTTLPTPEQLEDRRQYVDYWDGSSAVGRRAEAADTASADVVIFMEHLPQTLDKWLRTEGGKKNLCKIEEELNLVTGFMKSRGFLHFDAHAHNILVCNNHVYFADFGLALSRKFDLGPEERTFLEKHMHYDRCYVVAELAQGVIIAAVGDKESEVALNTYFSSEKMTVMLPPDVTSITERYRPIAVLWGKFFRGLREVSKSTPYPEIEVARAWAKL